MVCRPPQLSDSDDGSNDPDPVIASLLEDPLETSPSCECQQAQTVTTHSHTNLVCAQSRSSRSLYHFRLPNLTRSPHSNQLLRFPDPRSMKFRSNSVTAHYSTSWAQQQNCQNDCVSGSVSVSTIAVHPSLQTEEHTVDAMIVQVTMSEAGFRQPSSGNATEVWRRLDAHPCISLRISSLYRIDV